MPSILHLIETGGPGGAEHVFLELTSQLRVEPLRNIPLVGREGWLADRLRQRGLEPIVIPAQGSLNLTYLRRLVRVIRENDARLVVAHLFGAAVYASIASLLTRVPVVSILHGQSDVSGKERFAGIKRWLLAHGTATTVFVSSALKNDLQPRLRLPAERCAVIENGVDFSRYRPGISAGLRAELGLPSAAVLVGAVGNIRRAKGYETLLQAAQVVCASHPDTHFVIAGDTGGGLFPELQRLLEKLALGGRVHFLGLRSDVPAVLADFDLYVLSSYTEGFSLALVEAMASGLPVIATRSGGPEQIVEEGRTGLLVPPRDAPALAAEIQHLLADEAIRTGLATAAREAVTQRFGSERMLSNYHRLALELTASR